MLEKGLSVSENFDELAELAQHDPKAFEELRQHLIDSFIDSAPEDRQMNIKRYQWRIDQEKRKHSNSLGCCIHLSSMMTKRMDELRRQLDLVSDVSSDTAKKRFSKIKKAVIPLNVLEA